MWEPTNFMWLSLGSKMRLHIIPIPLMTQEQKDRELERILYKFKLDEMDLDLEDWWDDTWDDDGWNEEDLE